MRPPADRPVANRRAVRWLPGVVVAVAACGPSQDARLIELTGATMGTQFTVQIAGAPPGTDTDRLRTAIETELEAVNAAMSTYRPDSELSRFNASTDADWFAVSAATATVVAAAQTLSERSGGAFDVTIGPLVNLWGFGPGGPAAGIPSPAAIAAARERTGWRKLKVRAMPPALRKTIPDLSVDLSAIAKGHGVDRLAALLEAAGIVDYLVDIGGELRVRGLNGDGVPWRVAIERPQSGARRVQAIVSPGTAAVATSGDYRNFFVVDGQRYSHEIDPRTGQPVSHDLASVTVVAGSAMDADALATALIVLGPDDGLRYAEEHGIAALFVVRDGERFTERMSRAFGPLARRNAD